MRIFHVDRRLAQRFRFLGFVHLRTCLSVTINPATKPKTTLTLPQKSTRSLDISIGGMTDDKVKSSRHRVAVNRG
jgi:hypothetical protein